MKKIISMLVIVAMIAIIAISISAAEIANDETVLLNEIREANKIANVFKKVTSITAIDENVLLGDNGDYIYAENDVIYYNGLVMSNNATFYKDKDDELVLFPTSQNTLNTTTIYRYLYAETNSDYKTKYSISKVDYENGFVEFILSVYDNTNPKMPDMDYEVKLSFDTESLLIKQFIVKVITRDQMTDSNIVNYKIYYNTSPTEEAQNCISKIRSYIDSYNNGDICNVKYLYPSGDIRSLNVVKGTKLAGYPDYKELSLTSNSSYSWPSIIVTEDIIIEPIK